MQAPSSLQFSPRVVISGFSVIAPNGLIVWSPLKKVEGEAFSESSAQNEVTLDLAPYIGTRGLRFHDRSSRLALSAVKAMLDGTQNITNCSANEVSVVVGSDGALNAQHETVVDALKNPRMMNPKAYPNRGCNVIAGQVSLMFGLRGESSVISSGYRSGIDALIYSIRKCVVGQGPYIVASGEALCRARNIRSTQKNSCTEGALPSEIEAGVSCWVERADDTHPMAGDHWRVLAYRQTRCDKSESLDEWTERFLLASVDEEMRKKITHKVVCINGRCSIHEGSSTRQLRYDVYGATALVALFELMAKQSHAPSREDGLICVVSSDSDGDASAVLLSSAAAKEV